MQTPHLAPMSDFVSELRFAALESVTRIVLLTRFSIAIVPPNCRRPRVVVLRLRVVQPLHRALRWSRQLRHRLQLRRQVAPQVPFSRLSWAQQLESPRRHCFRVPRLRAPSRLSREISVLLLSLQALSVSRHSAGTVRPNVLTRRRQVRRVMSVVQSELQLFASVVVRVVVLVSVPRVPRAHVRVHRRHSGLRVQPQRNVSCVPRLPRAWLTRLRHWSRQLLGVVSRRVPRVVLVLAIRLEGRHFVDVSVLRILRWSPSFLAEQPPPPLSVTELFPLS